MESPGNQTIAERIAALYEQAFTPRPESKGDSRRMAYASEFAAAQLWVISKKIEQIEAHLAKLSSDRTFPQSDEVDDFPTN